MDRVDLLESLRWHKFEIPGQGFLSLVDVMGDDHSICRAARISYGVGTRSVSDDRTLLRYLMRNRHTTPFEMAEVVILVRVAMDTWRQWIRHRMASVNEYSTRYSEAIDTKQVTAPDAWRLQSSSNKQGSLGFVTEWGGDPRLPDTLSDVFGPNVTPGNYLSTRERALHELSDEIYRERLDFGVAREQARKDLPLSTMTEAYWKIDLHNLLHFLGLRMDLHAQQEIRNYATVIGREIVAPLFPLVWEAFEDYRLSAISLSSIDIDVVRLVCNLGVGVEDALASIDNNRERDECRVKLRRLGLTREVAV